MSGNDVTERENIINDFESNDWKKTSDKAGPRTEVRDKDILKESEKVIKKLKKENKRK